MTLQELNIRLLEINEALKKEVPALEKFEDKYYTAYRELFLSSQCRTEEARIQEAKQILRNRSDKIAEKYFNLKLEVRLLLTEKEILFEVSKNERIIYGNNSR